MGRQLIHVRLPETLWLDLRISALLERVSADALVVRAVARYLRDRKPYLPIGWPTLQTSETELAELVNDERRRGRPRTRPLKPPPDSVGLITPPLSPLSAYDLSAVPKALLRGLKR